MKKVKLLDIFGNIDNEMLERAIETDSKVKLQELKIIEKRKKLSSIFNVLSIFAGGVAVILLGVFTINNFSKPNQILDPNPLVELKSLEELEQYFSIDLSKYNIKEIENIIKYKENKMGQITYVDGTVFRISESNENNSGIHGGILINEKKYNDINVKIYELETVKYAVWQNSNYSYSYITNESENLEEILNKMV